MVFFVKIIERLISNKKKIDFFCQVLIIYTTTIIKDRIYNKNY